MTEGAPERGSAAGDAVAPEQNETIVLPEVPGLGGLYARGAVTAGRLAVARRAGHAPTSLPAVTYAARGEVPDAGHLTDYQHLLGEPATDALPAGYVHVVAFPVATALMTRPDFPLPLLGMVHLANTVTQHRAVRLGEALDVQAWARGLRPHRTGTQVDLVTQVTVSGEVVWTGTSTYLAKRVRLAGGEESAALDPVHGAATRAGEHEHARQPFVAPVPTGQWHLAADVGRRYASVSGDRNPIHLSSISARSLGFPRAIAHGMYTASRALADIGARRGEAFVWSAEFTKPVLLPSTPRIRVAAESDGFSYTVWRPDGQAPHLTGHVSPLR